MRDDLGDLTSLRREYLGGEFSLESLANCPVDQFSAWFAQAKIDRADDASSMTLATASASGMPSARIVLLKHYDKSGFAWYTDYESQKGQDLTANPQAELLFYWYGLERQVRIQGQVCKLDEAVAAKYFSQRPRESQISAAVSHQSKKVDSRETLQESIECFSQEHIGRDIIKPDRWGGYCLKPSKFEFWQGREGRLHDRLVYRLLDEHWQLERLQP